MKKLSLSLCLLLSVGTSSLWGVGYQGPSFFQYRHAEELQNRPLAAMDIQHELDTACARFDANTPPHAYDNIPSTDINHLNTFQAASHLASLFEAHVLRDDDLRTLARTEKDLVESFLSPHIFEDGGFSQQDFFSMLLDTSTVIRMTFLQKLSMAMHNGHRRLFWSQYYSNEEKRCRDALRHLSGIFDDWGPALQNMREVFLDGATIPHTMRMELVQAGVLNVPAQLPQPYGRFPNSILDALQVYADMAALAPQGHAWSQDVQAWLAQVDALRQRVNQNNLNDFDPAHLANLEEHLPTLLNSVVLDQRLLHGEDDQTQAQYRTIYQLLQYQANMPSYEEAKAELRAVAEDMDTNQNPIHTLQHHPFGQTWTELVDNRIAFTENNETEDRQNLALEKLLPIAVYCAKNLHQGDNGMENLIHLLDPANPSPSAVINPVYAFIAEHVRGHRENNP
ncbi:hypothetical protein [Candidatus Hepatobacter penaei]|uniref:hypothetical protein n=1 Tax=Candidatus Hepatobacter penaei TaxID=1274402 RepID=UPI0004F3C90B|nr:hypothetical protein [Candidatus Hepatobacter penaei]